MPSSRPGAETIIDSDVGTCHRGQQFITSCQDYPSEAKKGENNAL